MRKRKRIFRNTIRSMLAHQLANAVMPPAHFGAAPYTKLVAARAWRNFLTLYQRRTHLDTGYATQAFDEDLSPKGEPLTIDLLN